jgi:hypothetical protein
VVVVVVVVVVVRWARPGIKKPARVAGCAQLCYVDDSYTLIARIRSTPFLRDSSFFCNPLISLQTIFDAKSAMGRANNYAALLALCLGAAERFPVGH